MIRDINTDQLLDRLNWEHTYEGFQHDTAVVYVADLDDFESLHIPWSLHLSPETARGDLRDWADRYIQERGAEVVLYARTKDRALLDECARKLLACGYPEIFRLTDGFEKWVDEVLPTEGFHDPTGSLNVPRSSTPFTVSMKPEEQQARVVPSPTAAGVRGGR